MAAATCLPPSKCCGLGRRSDDRLSAKEESSTTHRMSSTSCVTASAFHAPNQHCESVQMLTRRRRAKQDPAARNVDSQRHADGAALAQNRSSPDGAVAASLNVQSNNNSHRSMNSKLLFMPSPSCQPPSLPPMPDSPAATVLACSSSAFSYSSGVVPPKPDASGAAIGIPIPPPLPRTGAQGSAATLPPLRSQPTRGSHNSKSEAPQYRKVFVPSTVIHNGVAQQMLVPMICMVAPTRHPNGTPLNASAALEAATANRGKSMPNFASKRNSTSGKEPVLARRRMLNRPHHSPQLPLCTHMAGTNKSKSNAHHTTRSSTRIAKRNAVPKAEAQCSDTAALTMLADAALMNL